jgi:glycosyltransferase involved in cell wall biosynthesis
MPLSVVIITRNAGPQLDACLASAAFADEMLVVDSGSTDDTAEVARRRGARVVEREWLGFGAQKQYAVDLALNDWVLCLDADERVSDRLRAGITRELHKPRARAYLLCRRNRFLGRWLDHGEGYPDWSLRLFHRGYARWSDDPVHERVITLEPVERLDGDLLHHSAETLHQYLDKQNRYTRLQAERLHAEGRTAGWPQLLVSPALRFLKFYFFRLGFLDGVPGLIHIAIGCMNSFNKYAKLIELQRTPKVGQ